MEFPPLRIAHFIDTNVLGGAETLIAQMCEATLVRGAVPFFVHFDHDELEEIVSALGVSSIRLSGKASYSNKKSLLNFGGYLKNILNDHRVDVLHSHLFGPALAGSTACSFSQIAHVATLHDRYILDEKRYRVPLICATTFIGTTLVPVSRSIEGVLQDVMLKRGSKIKRIYNGVPQATKHTIEGNRNVRAELGIVDGAVVAICVGRLVPLKRHKALIESWAMKESSPRDKLIIVGDGPEKASLEMLAKELDVEESVVFTGRRADVGALLSASDFFVLASQTEGLSCSILEAMSYGLPVLATDVGGNREMVCNGENGILVALGDEKALAHHLGQFASDETLREKMSKVSLRLIDEKFSLSGMMDAYWKVYSE